MLDFSDKNCAMIRGMFLVSITRCNSGLGNHLHTKKKAGAGRLKVLAQAEAC